MTHPLKQYRIENGLTLQELADAARSPGDIDAPNRSTIWRIENGKMSPSLAMIRKIIVATGGRLSANDFMGDVT